MTRAERACRGRETERTAKSELRIYERPIPNSTGSYRDAKGAFIGAWEKGADAYREGASINDNPYQGSSKSNHGGVWGQQWWKAWRAGYEITESREGKCSMCGMTEAGRGEK